MFTKWKFMKTQPIFSHLTRTYYCMHRFKNLLLTFSFGDNVKLKLKKVKTHWYILKGLININQQSCNKWLTLSHIQQIYNQWQWNCMGDSISEPFPTCICILMCMQQANFVDTVTKEEHAHNYEFLLLPQCIQSRFLYFIIIYRDF